MLAFVALAVACAAGAVAAAARRDLRALEGRVAALAPAQLDALDAAISARLDALAAPAPPAPAPAPVACPAVSAVPPADEAAAERVLAQHGVGPWRSMRSSSGTHWLERETPRDSTAGRALAMVGLHSRPSWSAAVFPPDCGMLEIERASGYVAPGAVEEAKRQATLALAALLLKHRT